MAKYTLHEYIVIGLGAAILACIPIRFILFPGSPANYIIAVIFLFSGAFIIYTVDRMHKRREAMRSG